jgi:hypothetical protein
MPYRLAISHYQVSAKVRLMLGQILTILFSQILSCFLCTTLPKPALATSPEKIKVGLSRVWLKAVLHEPSS